MLVLTFSGMAHLEARPLAAMMLQLPGGGSGTFEPVADRQITEGWRTDNVMGRLKIAIPLGRMPGEIPFPISFCLDGSDSATSYADASGNHTVQKMVTSTWNLGFGQSPYGYSRYLLEDGRNLSDADFGITSTASSNNNAAFAAYAGDVNALFCAYGLTPVALSPGSPSMPASVPSCLVHASGDLIKAEVPASYAFGSKYGSLLSNSNLAPDSAFFGTLTTYTLLIDKDRLRVLANCNGTPYPVLIADRFGHFVTFEWSRHFGAPADPIASVTRVELRNQRQEGITLRMLDWASKSNPANAGSEGTQDLARLDYVNFAGPSALVKGYPSLPNMDPSALEAGRPTSIRIGMSENLAQPTWSGSYGVASDPPVTLPSGSSVPDRTWSLSYDGYHELLVSITDPAGLQSTFTRTYNSLCSLRLNTTYSVYSVSQVTQADMSGKSSATRVLTWNRAFSAPAAPYYAASLTLSDWWTSAGSAANDRLETYKYGDTSNQGNPINNATDFQNAFLTSWSLTNADGSSAWASQTCASQTTALGHGGGLNQQLSMLKSSSTTRQGEAPTGTQLVYQDGNSLQRTQNQSLVGGKVVTSTTYRFDNRWAMLQPDQVNQTVVTRLDPSSSAAVAPGAKTTTHAWDTANPPLLQLQATYLDQGTSQHGQQMTYDGQGRLSTQSILHMEGGTTQASPSTLTFAYDDPTLASQGTGELTTRTTEYLDGNSTGTLHQSWTDFDAAHRPTTLIDEKGVATRMTYDLYGRPLTIVREGEEPVSKSYPDFWTTVTTQGGRTTTEYLDGFGRTIRTVLPTGVTQVPTYDLHSRVVRVTETASSGATRTRTTAYDPLDRVTSEVSFTGRRVDTTYATDGVNNLVTQTVDPLGLKLATTIQMDPWGQAVSQTAPNGDITAFTFDGWGNRTSISITPAGGGTPQIRSFFYDTLGRMVKKTEPETGTQTFGNFNALGQALTVTELGNQTSLPARIRTRVYDGLGRLRSQSAGITSETFQYQGPFLTGSSRTVGTKTVTQTFSYEAPGAKLSQESTSIAGIN